MCSLKTGMKFSCRPGDQKQKTGGAPQAGNQSTKAEQQLEANTNRNQAFCSDTDSNSAALKQEASLLMRAPPHPRTKPPNVPRYKKMLKERI